MRETLDGGGIVQGPFIRCDRCAAVHASFASGSYRCGRKLGRAGSIPAVRRCRRASCPITTFKRKCLLVRLRRSIVLRACPITWVYRHNCAETDDRNQETESDAQKSSLWLTGTL